MPNLPVRNLGGAGIISDIHPYDLPPNVFSAGVNVRFENGTVSRGPVYRDVTNLTAEDPDFDPSYLFPVPTISTGAESLIAVSKDYGTIYEILGETITDVTPTAVDVGDTQEPYNHAFLGGVTYLNRRSNVPFQKTSADAEFVPLTAWDEDWRCSSLRPYKDFLVALNVKKGAFDYPSMVKWSDLTQYGSAPADWDHTSTTNSAGETVLNQMRGGLVDGQILRDTMMLYGEHEVWAMTYIGGTFIFDFRKRFDDIGVMSSNCVVEVDGQHFVFDRNDIIVHDGASKRSIVHGKNKDFIYGGLVRDLQSMCFVTHNPRLNEIWFCYPSRDRLTGFANPSTGCNRAYVYNYRRDVGTFYDLPNVTAACNGVVATGLTYEDTAPTPYNEMGGTYGDESETERHHLFLSGLDASQGITASRIVGSDLIATGRLPRPIVPELLKDAFVERIGIDLDEQGAAISAYKSLLKVYPQIAVTDAVNGGSTFQFGANDVSASSPSWDTPQSFNPVTDYQISVRKAGRYLAHRLKHSGLSDFSYSGFDALLTVRGKR